MYRTADGGKNWERVLFVDENTGLLRFDDGSEQSACTVRGNVADRNPHVGPNKWGCKQRSFQIDRWRIDVEAAGGARTAACSNRENCGASGATSNSNRVYAEIETGDGVPFGDKHRTERTALAFGGWREMHGQVVSSDRDIRGRTHYYTREEISPDNENEVYFFSAAFSHTLDGGKTLTPLPSETGRRQPRNVD